MGEDVIADGLRLPQPAAMAHHEPAMRTQDRQMVGDRLGVGGADANIHQRRALHRPVGAARHEVVGRHLELVPRRGGDEGRRIDARRLRPRDGDAARQDHALVAILSAGELLQSVPDEAVDVAMVVRQQDPRLDVAPVAAGVNGRDGAGSNRPGSRRTAPGASAPPPGRPRARRRSRHPPPRAAGRGSRSPGRAA